MRTVIARHLLVPTLVAFFAVVAPLGGPVGADEPGLRKVGEVRVLNSSGGVASITPMVWGPTEDGRGAMYGFANDKLYQIDPDTFKVVDEIEITIPDDQAGYQVDVVAADFEGQRLFLGNRYWSGSPSKVFTATLEVVDLKKRSTEIFTLPRSDPPPAGTEGQLESSYKISAFNWSADEKTLYVATQGNFDIGSVTTAGVVATTRRTSERLRIHAVDPDRIGEPADSQKPVVKWSYAVPGCDSIPSNARFLSHTGTYLALYCGGAVVRIDMGPNSAASDAPDDFTAEHIWPPSDLGSNGGGGGNDDYIVLMRGGAGDQKSMVFDIERRAWTGLTALGSGNIWGIVVSPTGRVYIADEGTGIRVIDASEVPVGLGKSYWLGFPLFKVTDMAYDPIGGRLWVKSVDEGASATVFDDEIPYPESPEDDPDRAVTSTRALGSGFGARFTLVNLPRGLFGLAAFDASSEVPGPTWSLLAGAVSDGEVADDVARVAARPLAPDGDTSDQIPGLATALDGAGARCADYGEAAGDQQGPAVSARCSREDGAVEAAAGTFPRAAPAPSVDVAYASSEVRLRRDAGGLATSEVEAVARGVNILGHVFIGEVKTTATARAGGVPGSADSSITTTVTGVRIVDQDGNVRFACGSDQPCDLDEVAREAGKALAGQGRPRVALAFAQVDPDLRKTPGGARAVVREDLYRHYNDEHVDKDKRWDVVGLQIIVHHDGIDVSREVVELAGVYAEANRKVEGAVPPAALRLRLLDDEGRPLAGGEFEVDGPLGPGLLGPSPCRTGDDGVGSCDFGSVAPGAYTIRQLAAPAGYAIPNGAGEFQVTLQSIEAREVQFTNLRATAGVQVMLIDQRSSAPLPGGRFSLSRDDGHGSRAGPAQAECVTDAQGSCSLLDLPLGSYVLREKEPPTGYRPADDVAFVLAQPGQLARIRIVNGREGAAAKAAGNEAAGNEIEFFDEGGFEPVVSVIDPGGNDGESVLDAARRILGRIPDFLRRHPGEALLFAMVWMLVGLPGYLAVRRRDLILTKETT